MLINNSPQVTWKFFEEGKEEGNNGKEKTLTLNETRDKLLQDAMKELETYSQHCFRACWHHDQLENTKNFMYSNLIVLKSNTLE